MSKPSSRKDKVPKITEEEYVAYLTSLRETEEGARRENQEKSAQESGLGGEVE